MDVAIFDTLQTITLCEHIRAAIEHARQTAQPVLFSMVERSDRYNAVSLFAQASVFTQERFLWTRPAQDLTLVGLGTALQINTNAADHFQQVAALRQAWLDKAYVEGQHGQMATGPLFFGGFNFDPQTPKSATWADFPAGRLVLPKLLYTLHGEHAYLTLNVVVHAETNAQYEALHLLELWQQVINTPLTSPLTNEMLSRTELSNATLWKQAVAQASAAIRAGEFQKTVLARGVRLEACRAFDTAAAVSHLSQAFPHCAVFALAHAGQCFMGATPERLLSMEQGQLKTMALAGSIRRGKTPEEDYQLAQTLLNSAKDRAEHQLVINSIVYAVRDAVEDLTVSAQPTILKLPNVQHLYTPIEGHLKPQYTLLSLVERLHPTPAVGGFPQAAALDFIRQHEHLDRGWYAAPIGWIGGDGDGEFVVALRSALVRGNVATLYAGCGIMGDSDPEQEYQESALKLQPMLQALSTNRD